MCLFSSQKKPEESLPPAYLYEHLIGVIIPNSPLVAGLRGQAAEPNAWNPVLIVGGEQILKLLPLKASHKP